MNPSTRRVLWLAAFFVLWLVLVGTRTPAELVAGLIASALATTASELLVGTGLLPFSRRARSWAPAGYALARILLDTALLVASLARRRRGRFRVSDLPAGRDWRHRAERGVGALGASLAPNTIVVDIDAERRVALRHELARSDRDPLR